MQRLTSCVSRDANVDDAPLCIIDSKFCRAYLRLLRPQKLDGVAVGILRLRGIQTNRLASLNMND